VTDLTYPEIGATRGEDLPPGYRHVRRHVRIGDGGRSFDAAAEALMTWDVHRRSGLHPVPDSPRVVDGAEVRCRFVVLTFPARVVWTVRTDDETGFGYGTLPGHPERGEEAFVVSRNADGGVWFTVRAFSRPARWFTRLGGPAGHLVQDYVTGRYVRAARAAADV
jgi:uncharacterized protein (UPF0548 family)